MKTEKPIIWTSEDFKKIFGAETSLWMATGISIDTRRLNPGDIFIAIAGQHLDGSQFISEAFRKGAVAVISKTIPTDMQGDEAYPIIKVDDPITALKKLALVARENFTGKIIGITGSVGKTTCKEMVKAILGTNGLCYANEGNFNNQLGLPLSLAHLHKSYDYGVFELGMNRANEIYALSEMLRPHIACVTNVNPVHLEFFDNLDGIAMAKAEIFEGVELNGKALVLGDNAHIFAILSNVAKKSGIQDIRTFGKKNHNNYHYSESSFENGQQIVETTMNKEDFTYRLSMLGEHAALNSLLAFAIADMAGLDLDDVKDSLANFTAIKGRGELTAIKHINGEGTLLLIDESYNASPASVVAVLNVLKSLPHPKQGRKVVILGDMKELGKESNKFHVDLKEDINDAGVDGVITVGAEMKLLFDELDSDKQLQAFTDFDSAISHIWQFLHPNDIVLIKGSFSMRLTELVEYLKTS